jgi:integrase
VPVESERAEECLRRECECLGVPVVTMHGLHRLRASLLLEGGVSVPQVSGQLGHSTPPVTLRVYAHVVRRGDDAATAAISGAMRR